MGLAWMALLVWMVPVNFYLARPMFPLVLVKMVLNVKRVHAFPGHAVWTISKEPVMRL